MEVERGGMEWAVRVEWDSYVHCRQSGGGAKVRHE